MGIEGKKNILGSREYLVNPTVEGTILGPITGCLGATCYVVANNAKAEVKAHAQALHDAGYPVWVCDGIDDQVEIQAAIDALPAGGGKVLILEGNYSFSAAVSRPINNVTIQGMGRATYIARDGVNPIFSVGAQNAWTFTDIAFDAGGIDRGTSTNTRFIRTWVGGVPQKDLETPPRLRLVQTVPNIQSYARNIWMEDDFLYLALGSMKQLLVFDIFYPEGGINQIGSVSLPGEPCHIIKRGDYLYITLFEHVQPAVGLAIVDVSIPSSPVVIGTVLGGGLDGSHGGYLVGNYFYVANYWGSSISAVNISDVYNPFVEVTLSDARLTGPHDITADPPFLYVGTNYGGTGADATATEGSLTIIDISVRTSPVIVGHVETYEIQHLAKRGRYVFATSTFHGAAAPSGLYAIDVSDPTAPVITSFLTGFGGYWVHLAGDYAFVAASRGLGLQGLYTVDISNPASMKVVDSNLFPYPDLGPDLAHVFVYGKYVATINRRPPSTLYLFEIEQGLNLPALTAGGANFPVTRVLTRTVTVRHSDLFMDVLAASTTHIHPAITPDGLQYTTVTSSDVPRNAMLRITNTDGVNPQTPNGGNVVIEGVDARGNPTSETLTVPATSIPAGGTSDVFGSKAFATVSKVTYYSETNTAITVSVGISDKLGLSNVIHVTGDVYKVKKNNADVAVGIVDTANGTVDCAMIVSGDDFTIYYRSNLNILA